MKHTMNTNTLSLESGYARMRRRLRAMLTVVMALIMIFCTAIPAFAEDAAAGDADPLKIIENLTSFVYSVVNAIGTLALIYGFIQLGLSFWSHDPSQRMQGVLALVGSLFFFSAKWIITFISSGTA